MKSGHLGRPERIQAKAQARTEAAAGGGGCVAGHTCGQTEAVCGGKSRQDVLTSRLQDGREGGKPRCVRGDTGAGAASRSRGRSRSEPGPEQWFAGAREVRDACYVTSMIVTGSHGSSFGARGGAVLKVRLWESA